MQETANKQKRMADEMDINLEVFNLETDFFGDLHCSSRWTDILCDAQAQYGDYSELDECPMWGKWVKEGGEWVIGRYKLWTLWKGIVFEDRRYAAKADEDGGEWDGGDEKIKPYGKP